MQKDKNSITKMLYFYIARLQPVAGLIFYFVLLLATHAHAAI